MKYSIGKTQKEDIPAIADLEQHCFSMPLTEKQIRSLIEAGNTCFLTAKMSDPGGCESEVLGYIGMQTVLDEGYILNIAVSESYRQQGIADALMESIEEESVRPAQIVQRAVFLYVEKVVGVQILFAVDLIEFKQDFIIKTPA